MWPFASTQRAEDPERLKRFLDELVKLDWGRDNKDSLDRTFYALNDLIYHEVLFYYRARKQQRIFSIATRGLALFLGTLGVLAPLLAAADSAIFLRFSAYGYPLLASAAAALLLNRMFGATGGHIRYVTAQLELERAVTKFRLAWAGWLAQTGEDRVQEQQRQEAFNLMNAFVDHAYGVIQEETSVWGKSVSEALKEYEKRIAGHQFDSSVVNKATAEN